MNIVDVSLFTVIHIEILAVQVLFICPFWGYLDGGRFINN